MADDQSPTKPHGDLLLARIQGREGSIQVYAREHMGSASWSLAYTFSLDAMSKERCKKAVRDLCYKDLSRSLNAVSVRVYNLSIPVPLRFYYAEQPFKSMVLAGY